MSSERTHRRTFYKDWGSGQPIVFSHGWPLSADDWDAQMMFFLGRGYPVIAYDLAMSRAVRTYTLDGEGGYSSS